MQLLTPTQWQVVDGHLMGHRATCAVAAFREYSGLGIKETIFALGERYTLLRNLPAAAMRDRAPRSDDSLTRIQPLGTIG
jgi:hypothetical protein